MMINKKLFDILACPLCKGELKLSEDKQTLICRFDRLAFPIRDDIPVLLLTEARELSEEEVS